MDQCCQAKYLGKNATVFVNICMHNALIIMHYDIEGVALWIFALWWCLNKTKAPHNFTHNSPHNSPHKLSKLVVAPGVAILGAFSLILENVLIAHETVKITGQTDTESSITTEWLYLSFERFSRHFF